MKNHISPQDSKGHLKKFCNELSNGRDDIEKYYLERVNKYIKDNNL